MKFTTRFVAPVRRSLLRMYLASLVGCFCQAVVKGTRLKGDAMLAERQRPRFPRADKIRPVGAIQFDPGDLVGLRLQRGSNC
jgi:hypothetical protein